MPTRTHVSPNSLIKKIKPSNVKEEGGPYKPKGFWYEVNGDWRRWLRGEGYRWSVGNRHVHGSYLYRVSLNRCNVLKIATLQELDSFHETYSEILNPIYGGKEINWGLVSEGYDGVEIAPYQWERRLDFKMNWYYGWDCASGVIWQPRNATVTLIRKLA